MAFNIDASGNPYIISPFAAIYDKVVTRFKNKLPEVIRYVEQDLGQLEFYDSRPPVAFPCVLVDFDNFRCTDMSGKSQMVEGDVIFRLALDTWSSGSSLDSQDVRAYALKYFEIEHRIFQTFHGWAPNFEDVRGNGKRAQIKCGRLTRSSAATEKREDNIRVREIRFRIEFEDYSATDAFIKVGNFNYKITDNNTPDD